MRWYLLACAALALAAAGCGSSSSGTPQVRLDAGPAAAALTDPVHVSVSGLPAAGLVTVQASTVGQDGPPWQSSAVFRASGNGTLNLATAVPVSGSYHVADAAGLLWSLHPPTIISGVNPLDGSVRNLAVRLEVLTGGQVRAEATLRRQAPITASTETVRQDGFDGTLYTSAALRPGAPAVVVLTGATGGEDRATAEGLAMSGYPALSLAYFREPGLPRCACSIPLEYFARAVSWLRAQPAGRGRPVVLYGLSLGSEAVLLTAAYLPHLADAVIASSPTVTVDAAVGGTGPVWTFGGKPVEPGTPIPVTKIRVPLLIGDGGQDNVWAAAASATFITRELDGSPGHPPVTNLYYPGAGHGYFGLPPYYPFFSGIELGGSVQANALATEQFWTRMTAFLNHLSTRQP
jgi:dienelactone hydrolase